MFDLSERCKTLLQFPFVAAGLALCHLRENSGETLSRSVIVDLVFFRRTTLSGLAYMAEEHGVFGPAVIRAELLGRASVLCNHQLLGHGMAVDAGLTVFPPAFSQVVSKEELTAWEEGGEEGLRVTMLHYKCHTFCTLRYKLLTIAAEEAVFVVNSLGISGDLFYLTVFTQAGHIVGFLELLRAVHAAHENQLVLHTQSV